MKGKPARTFAQKGERCPGWDVGSLPREVPQRSMGGFLPLYISLLDGSDFAPRTQGLLTKGERRIILYVRNYTPYLANDTFLPQGGEKMYRAKITSKGQITIPAGLRGRLGLRPGDMLEIRESPAGYIIRKYVKASPFDRYVGHLGDRVDLGTDALIREMRGDDD